jgi:hypothetical protein
VTNRYNCSFDVYWYGNKTAHIDIEHGVVKTVAYTDDKCKLPFGFLSDGSVAKRQIDLFWESRSFPKHKADYTAQMNAVGLTEYDAYEIVRKTKGRLLGDGMRIEFVT